MRSSSLIRRNDSASSYLCEETRNDSIHGVIFELEGYPSLIDSLTLTFYSFICL